MHIVCTISETESNILEIHRRLIIIPGTLCITVVVLAQTEQLLRILLANILVRLLTTQCLLDVLSVAVPPATAILNGLIRIIDTEQQSLRAKIFSDILQSLSAEVSTGGEVDVVLEVIVNGLLTHNISCLGCKGLLNIFEPVVDAPEVEGDVLTQVTNDDLELGEAVEDAVGDHTEEMQRYAVGEAEGRSNEGTCAGRTAVGSTDPWVLQGGCTQEHQAQQRPSRIRHRRADRRRDMTRHQALRAGRR